MKELLVTLLRRNLNAADAPVEPPRSPSGPNVGVVARPCLAPFEIPDTAEYAAFAEAGPAPVDPQGEAWRLDS